MKSAFQMVVILYSNLFNKLLQNIPNVVIKGIKTWKQQTCLLFIEPKTNLNKEHYLLFLAESAKISKYFNNMGSSSFQ